MKNDPATGEPYKHTAFMSMAGRLWKAMDDKAKAKYETLAAKDKVRAEK